MRKEFCKRPDSIPPDQEDLTRCFALGFTFSAVYIVLLETKLSRPRFERQNFFFVFVFNAFNVEEEGGK